MRTHVPLVLLAASLAPSVRGDEPAAALPASTIAYVSVDVGRAVRELPELEVVKLLADEEVADFLAGAVEFVKKETRQPRAALKLLEMYGLPDIVEGRAVVALLGFSGTDEAGEVRWDARLGPDAPASPSDLVLLVETSGREAFEVAVQRALELIPEDRETEEVAGAHPHRVTRFPSLGSPGLAHGFVGDTFVAALRPERFDELASSLAAGGREQDALADAPAFAAWRAESTRGTGILDVWFDPRALRARLTPTAAQDPDLALLDRLGLAAVEGIGFSYGVADGRLRDSIAVVAGGARTGSVFALLDAFSGGGVAADVPAGVDVAAAARVDPVALMGGVTGLLDAVGPRARDAFEEGVHDLELLLEVDLREDVLTTLGGLHSAWLTAKAGPIPIPDGGVSLALKDPARMDGLLGELLRVIADEDETVSARPFELDGGGAAYTLSGLPVVPAFAVVGDRLRVASSPMLLRRRLADEGGAGLGSDADFARCLAQNVGPAHEDVAALLYLDAARLTEVGLQAAGPFLPMAAMQAPFELDASLMPLPDTVSSYLSGYLMTLRVDDRVVALDASSPVGGLVLSTAALAFAQWSIDKYEEKRARERARVLEPR